MNVSPMSNPKFNHRSTTVQRLTLLVDVVRFDRTLIVSPCGITADQLALAQDAPKEP